VDLAVDDPSKGAAVGLDHPPRTQVVHGAGDQDLTQPELLADCRSGGASRWWEGPVQLPVSATVEAMADDLARRTP
jgi:hypothetical protein